jgi:hypothetical protein
LLAIPELLHGAQSIFKFSARPPSASHSQSDSAADSIRQSKEMNRSVYDQDGLRSVHNHDFMEDPAFRRAYARGITAVGTDYQWHWRVHVGLWAAFSASKLTGDFVECGVNRGFLSSAIMEHLEWDRLGKTFYLLDTFAGVAEEMIPDNEEERQRNQQNLTSGFYVRGVESVARNFSQWRNVKIIQGRVPDTLPQVKTKQISYLHLDMNCAPPEIAALNYFWEKLISGAMVLLDDYAYIGYQPQKEAMDVFAKERGVRILSLPTGQGLLVKPVKESSWRTMINKFISSIFIGLKR